MLLVVNFLFIYIILYFFTNGKDILRRLINLWKLEELPLLTMVRIRESWLLSLMSSIKIGYSLMANISPDKPFPSEDSVSPN